LASILGGADGWHDASTTGGLVMILGKWDEELMSGKDGEELEVVCQLTFWNEVGVFVGDLHRKPITGAITPGPWDVLSSELLEILRSAL